MHPNIFTKTCIFDIGRRPSGQGSKNTAFTMENSLNLLGIKFIPLFSVVMRATILSKLSWGG
jgi:hypothetical protein